MTDCIIEDAKVRDYLLNFDSKDGQAKARFFIAGGFSRDDPAPFVAALKRHFLDNPPYTRLSSFRRRIAR